jgi:succinate dehydrogenase/fumarate reductase flavoprotein subunit
MSTEGYEGVIIGGGNAGLSAVRARDCLAMKVQYPRKRASRAHLRLSDLRVRHKAHAGHA